jgi:radical SAM superfamily enzyme YgiQ (UPF0313 family)
MRILFIQPATNPNVWGGDAIFITEPLWAEYLSAGLNKHHDVRLLDMRLEKTTVEQTLSEFEPDVVGMTAYTVDVNTVKELARRIKALNKECRVVVGGYFASGNPEKLYDPHIDVVVPGEGVNTLRELVGRWDIHGTRANLEDIPGLALPTEVGMRLTAGRRWPSLDSYTFPDRSMSAHVRHQYFDKWMKPVASITSSYSCPFRCEFCCLWPTTDGKYLARGPESFVNELETIREENVWFTDDEALIDARRMERIATLIEERGIHKKYFFMTRTDSIRRNPDLIEHWARIGLKRVMVGFESIRSKDLLDFRKDATTDDGEEAIRIPQRNGLEINSNFVLTQDYEPHDFENLHRYVEARQLGLPLYFILTPFPGTVTYRKLESEIFLRDYDYYDLLHTVLPTRMPLRDYYTAFSRLYGAIEPLRRGIAGYGENLDELVVKNLRKVLGSMRTGSPVPPDHVQALGR